MGKKAVSLSSSWRTSSSQKMGVSSSALRGLPVPGFSRGAGFLFMSARRLYQAVGSSCSVR